MIILLIPFADGRAWHGRYSAFPTKISTLMICLLLPMALVAAQLGTLEGYVFRETDGGPPRRPLTVELINQGRSRYHQTSNKDGTFTFKKVREGDYTIRARFSNFIIVEDIVTVMSQRKNFAAVMLPKRRPGAQTFRTIGADQLAAQSDRKMQKKLKQAGGLVVKRDFAGAALLYEEVAAKGTQPGIWDTLGLLYLQMGRKDEAIQAFEKAIEQEPKNLLPYTHLGTAYLEERRYKELLGMARRALAVDSKWLTAHVFLGEAQAGTRIWKQPSDPPRRLLSWRKARPQAPICFWRRSAGPGAIVLAHAHSWNIISS